MVDWQAQSRCGVFRAAVVLGAWSAAASLASAQGSIQVSGFQVSGNTLLDARALDAVLLPLLGQFLLLNVALAIFNLLPIPPLDGSRIVDGLVPYERRALWDRVSRPLGLVLLLVFFLFVAPLLLAAVQELRAAFHALAGA